MSQNNNKATISSVSAEEKKSEGSGDESKGSKGEQKTRLSSEVKTPSDIAISLFDRLKGAYKLLPNRYKEEIAPMLPGCRWNDKTCEWELQEEQQQQQQQQQQQPRQPQTPLSDNDTYMCHFLGLPRTHLQKNYIDELLLYVDWLVKNLGGEVTVDAMYASIKGKILATVPIGTSECVPASDSAFAVQISKGNSGKVYYKKEPQIKTGLECSGTRKNNAKLKLNGTGPMIKFPELSGSFVLYTETQLRSMGRGNASQLVLAPRLFAPKFENLTEYYQNDKLIEKINKSSNKKALELTMVLKELDEEYVTLIRHGHHHRIKARATTVLNDITHTKCMIECLNLQRDIKLEILSKEVDLCENKDPNSLDTKKARRALKKFHEFSQRDSDYYELNLTNYSRNYEKWRKEREHKLKRIKDERGRFVRLTGVLLEACDNSGQGATSDTSDQFPSETDTIEERLLKIMYGKSHHGNKKPTGISSGISFGHTSNDEPFNPKSGVQSNVIPLETLILTIHIYLRQFVHQVTTPDELNRSCSPSGKLYRVTSRTPWINRWINDKTELLLENDMFLRVISKVVMDKVTFDPGDRYCLNKPGDPPLQMRHSEWVHYREVQMRQKLEQTALGRKLAANKAKQVCERKKSLKKERKKKEESRFHFNVSEDDHDLYALASEITKFLESLPNGFQYVRGSKIDILYNLFKRNLVNFRDYDIAEKLLMNVKQSLADYEDSSKK